MTTYMPIYLQNLIFSVPDNTMHNNWISGSPDVYKIMCGVWRTHVCNIWMWSLDLSLVRNSFGWWCLISIWLSKKMVGNKTSIFYYTLSIVTYWYIEFIKVHRIGAEFLVFLFGYPQKLLQSLISFTDQMTSTSCWLQVTLILPEDC